MRRVRGAEYAKYGARGTPGPGREVRRVRGAEYAKYGARGTPGPPRGVWRGGRAGARH
ncbi:hypothetical protein Shyhy02_65780 [Streptomyces hygroscopicus subsp. hygroscopicus]|nr:hypothetical protein Shyhy02_65780 [Streptomyces hygroscopicus subsp. hygroscopicus]